jgi:hypothetical protein
VLMEIRLFNQCNKIERFFVPTVFGYNNKHSTLIDLLKIQTETMSNFFNANSLSQREPDGSSLPIPKLTRGKNVLYRREPDGFSLDNPRIPLSSSPTSYLHFAYYLHNAEQDDVNPPTLSVLHHPISIPLNIDPEPDPNKTQNKDASSPEDNTTLRLRMPTEYEYSMLDNYLNDLNGKPPLYPGIQEDQSIEEGIAFANK